MTIVVLVVVSSGTARRRLGAPAALGVRVRARGALMAQAAAPAIETMRASRSASPASSRTTASTSRPPPGEVHALLGENGAGKTTLSHILTGLYRPDEGEISLYGEPVAFASPREAIDAGVCMVHQHFRLVERFTVAENLVLGDRRGAGRQLPHRPAARSRRQVRELGERYSLRVDPHAHDLAALGRRAAAGRDPQGALPGRPGPHPRRADGGADAGRGRHALRDAAPDGGRGADGHLHLAQAARGDGGLRPGHRAPGGRGARPRCRPPRRRRSRSRR